MEVATTTTEATLSAIHESLAQLSVKLGRIAARQDEMLFDLKKTTAALAPTATTTPMFVSSRVREQTTKPSSSSLFSAIQVVAAGAPHADEVVATAMPTRCSTVGSAANVGNDQVVVMSPSGGDTQAAVRVLGEPSLDRSALKLSLPIPTVHLAKCCLGDADVRKSAILRGSSPGLSMNAALLNDTALGCTLPATALPVGRDTCNTAQTLDGMVEEEVFTTVGGLSLFSELCVDASDAMAKMLPENMVWDDEISDQVLTHIGSLSLFVEIDMEIHQVLEDSMNKVTCLSHTTSGVNQVCLVMPSDKGKLQLSREMQHEITQCNLWLCVGGKSDAQFSCHQPTNLNFLLYHGSSSGILILPWDPGTHEDMVHELLSLLRQAGGGLTISQRFGTKMRRAMTIRQYQNSVDCDCLLPCTNQHTIQNYMQMGQGFAVILFLVLQSIYNCKKLCLLKCVARKFQWRSWNCGVHKQLVKEVLQPEVAQHSEWMNISCQSLVHAVCTWALYWNHIGDYRRLTILICNNHWSGLLIQKSEEWCYIYSDVEATYFQFQARNQLVFSEIGNWHLESRSFGNFGMIWLIYVHKGLSNCCDFCSFTHLANHFRYKQWIPGVHNREDCAK